MQKMPLAAAYYANHKIVRQFIVEGADINLIDASTVLMIAAANQPFDIVR